MPTLRNNVILAPAEVLIKQRVLSRKLTGIQNHHRLERQNRMDRRKYLTRSRKALDGYQRNLENYKALVEAGWDVSRIYSNREHRPSQPRLYEKSVIFEHSRVSPLKLGSPIRGTRFGGKLK